MLASSENAQGLIALTELIESCAVPPVIDRTYPLNPGTIVRQPASGHAGARSSSPSDQGYAISDWWWPRTSGSRRAAVRIPRSSAGRLNQLPPRKGIATIRRFGMGQQPVRQNEAAVQSVRLVEVQPGRAAGNVENWAGQDRAPSPGVRRCLIVDDNERFLAAAQNHLSRGGLKIVGTAMSQAQALRQAKALQPDVVLVDVSLGCESGFEVARRLVENVPNLESSVVLISSRDEDDLADLIGASPAVGFISKNFLSVRAIERLLSSNGF